MKLLTTLLLLILLNLACKAQFLYKDLVVTRQNNARWQFYKDGGVRSVRLNSFEKDGQPTEGFLGVQEVAGDFSRIITHTKAAAATGNPDSWIIAYYSPKGLLTKIEDTSDTYRSITEYRYSPDGHIDSIVNTAIETDNHLTEIELHVWQYNAQGRPSGMLKIRNGNDTTFIRFVTDEKGNIAEEKARRNNHDLPIIYYYYDADNRLTDIVRYNQKAQRLLPDNIFEYDSDGRLSSMLVVPDGSNDYQKWMYEYNDTGLKSKETCFNRRGEMLGKIEYQYSFK
jgi:hypothetical protein